jgi:hypothetical protein
MSKCSVVVLQVSEEQIYTYLRQSDIRRSDAHAQTPKVSYESCFTTTFTMAYRNALLMHVDDADHSGINCLRPLKHWDREFVKAWMSVCVYSVFVLLSV